MYVLTTKVDGETENQVVTFEHETLALKAFAESIQYADTLRSHLTCNGWAVAMFESACIHIP